MKEKEILECLIEYSQLLHNKYNCNVSAQFKENGRYTIKFFLVNEKLALTFVIDLSNECNVKERFDDMVEYYKEKCTKWCGGVKDDTKEMDL